MIRRGQMHNREIIRTRPLCMNPSTSTQLCQTAWAIIFSNSCGLESDYRAPSVTQTLVPKQVTSWVFICIPSIKKIKSFFSLEYEARNCAEFTFAWLSFTLCTGWQLGILKGESEWHTCWDCVIDRELLYTRLLIVYFTKNVWVYNKLLCPECSVDPFGSWFSFACYYF